MRASSTYKPNLQPRTSKIVIVKMIVMRTWPKLILRFSFPPVRAVTAWALFLTAVADRAATIPTTAPITDSGARKKNVIRNQADIDSLLLWKPGIKKGNEAQTTTISTIEPRMRSIFFRLLILPYYQLSKQLGIEFSTSRSFRESAGFSLTSGGGKNGWLHLLHSFHSNEN